MNKAKLLICSVIAATALTACTAEDNPVVDPVIDPTDTATVVVDNPSENVSDQPAYAPGM